MSFSNFTLANENLHQNNKELRDKVAHQVIIRVKKNINAMEFNKELPSQFRVIYSYANYHVIESTDRINEKAIEEIKNLPSVVYAEKNYISYPIEDCKDCGHPILNNEDENQIIDQITTTENVFQGFDECEISHRCKNTKRNQFWAQEKVSTKDMLNELEEIGIQRGHSKIAILDTGLDQTYTENQLDFSNIDYEKGFPQAGEPTVDEMGHGSSVAGVISGKNGVGSAPGANLSIYRVNLENSSTTSSSRLRQSILNACNNGNEIINVSWGNDQDESGQKRIEESDPEFIKELGEKGCLVIVAAGNESFKEVHVSDNHDDAYLRVAATNANGQLAEFSSSGEITAPGSAVFSLTNSEQSSFKYYFQKKNYCEGKKGKFVNGTSFAAPITSAIAYQVLGVLKDSGKLEFISKQKKVALINRILKASVFGNSINGLRAVHIAKLWGETDNNKIPEHDELSQLLSNADLEICKKQTKECTTLDQCQKIKSCYKKKKKVATLCRPSNITVTKDLFQTSLLTKNLDLSTNWLSVIIEEKQSTVDENTLLAKSLWKSYQEQWKKEKVNSSNNNNMVFSTATELLPIIINKKMSYDEIKKEVISFLTSQDTLDHLKLPYKNGGQDVINRILAVLKSTHSALGTEQTKAILKEWYYNNIDTIERIPFLTVASISRLLDILQTSTEMNNFSELSKEIESQLYIKINQTDPKHVFSSEKNTYDFFSPMLERNIAILTADIANALDDNDSSKIGFIQLRYALKNPNEIEEVDRFELSYFALNSCAKGKGWVNGCDKLIPLAKKLFSSNFSGEPTRDKIIYKLKLEGLLENSNSLDFFNSFFPKNYTNTPKVRYLDYDNDDPIFNTDFYTNQAESLLTSLKHQNKEVLSRLQHEIKPLIQRSLPFMIDKAKKEKANTKENLEENKQDKIKVPIFDYQKYHRKNTQKKFIESKEVDRLDTVDIIDYTFMWAIQNLKENPDDYFAKRNLYNVIDILNQSSNHQGLKTFPLLPKQGGWNYAAKELIQTLNEKDLGHYEEFIKSQLSSAITSADSE